MQSGAAACAANLLSDEDLRSFHEGRHYRLYEKLGAHFVAGPGGAPGVYFAVWAPEAERVGLIGDFTGWREDGGLEPKGTSGIWQGFVPGVRPGMLYKYRIHSRHQCYRVDKADPFSVFNETPPKSASITWKLDYSWQDGAWMNRRRERAGLDKPLTIYEMHLGSWRRVRGEGNRSLSYREMAPLLVDHIKRLGFTHVEFLPVMDHPFFGSWGYQVTGYFAASGRYGTPQDLMFLIDTLHQSDIGVILDWVPSHFPTDEQGLGFFDGSHLYEHADARQGLHREWGSYIFNYGRNQVRSFLISNALFWLDRYHADGLRVDAVASMLYLDYGRGPGEWVANRHGGRENLEAIEFLRNFNEAVYGAYPDCQTIAEESTSWPMVSRPVYSGGLGFGLKWDMGWMHDTLAYFAQDPIQRKYHHDKLTFRMIYADHENFVLPLSHDEVVYGKRSLLGKMPGDDWQKFANLRLLLGYMYGQQGKKLLFMGTELAQWREWVHDDQLDWELLERPAHDGVRHWLADLNTQYVRQPALHQWDCHPGGFEWIDCRDADMSVLSFLRRGSDAEQQILIVCNFTPVPRLNYRIGAPRGGIWHELLNSDAQDYGGSGMGNFGGVEAAPIPVHGRSHALTLTLPPLAALFFAPG
jgi:1,4-alpha-glucan branching enzyme